MKIDPTTLAAMAALIEPLDTPEVREAYRTGNFPRAATVKDLDTRFRWDLFHAARGYQAVADQDVTDAHIDTALRRIVAPL